MCVCGWISVETEIAITVDSLTSLSPISYAVLICLAHTCPPNLLVLKKGTQILPHARRFTLPLPYIKP